MKKFIKQTLAYSFVFGFAAVIAPVAVFASNDATKINLYGINTGIIASAPVFTAIEVVALVASVVAGIVLIANGKFLKRILSK